MRGYLGLFLTPRQRRRYGGMYAPIFGRFGAVGIGRGGPWFKLSIARLLRALFR